MKKRCILMFTMGKWSHSNNAIVDALQEKLPEHYIQVVDLMKEFKRDRLALLFCLLDLPILAWHAFIDKAFDRYNLLYAPVTSRFIGDIAHKMVQQEQPDFTIQTTTRFNASTELVPHFTVVDITVAAGRHGYCELFNSSEYALDRLHAFQQKIYSASTAVFAMGQYVRDSLVWDYSVAPHRAIAIGAGPNIALGKRSEIIGSHNILFVGTDWIRKGGPTLLAAFRLLKKKHPQATLNIVGCRPKIDEPGVNVIGRVAREDLHQYFTMARVFALPTVHEAFGIAFVEALHFGLPIVATGINAIPEMVVDGVNGCTIQPGNVDELAYALDQIMGSDEIALAYGNASYDRARLFTWDRSGRLLSESMLQLIKLGLNADRHIHEQQPGVGNTALSPENTPSQSLSQEIYDEIRRALHATHSGISALLKYF